MTLWVERLPMKHQFIQFGVIVSALLIMALICLYYPAAAVEWHKKAVLVYAIAALIGPVLAGLIRRRRVYGVTSAGLPVGIQVLLGLMMNVGISYIAWLAFVLSVVSISGA